MYPKDEIIQARSGSLLHNLDPRHETCPTFDWLRRVMQQTKKWEMGS